ncbi:RCC1/BLIP-II [Cubamyces sp. BRFM 1775]|nr:RCC1/BLIP-II [Cubamyces sp. BRFM 1775]
MPSLNLYSAGSNARGQLATGNIDDAHHFSPCVFSGTTPGALPANVVAVDHIACGANHTLALLRKENGNREVWGCGDGSRGQLGPSYCLDIAQASESSSATAVFKPLHLNLHQIESPDGTRLDGYTVRLIAAGWETSYVVVSCPGRDDVLLSMGADDFGNLGIGGTRRQKASRPSSEHVVHVVRLRELVPSQNAQEALTVTALRAGPHHTVAHFRTSGPDSLTQSYIAGWGTARHGQLGHIQDRTGRPLSFIPAPCLISAPSLDKITHIALGNQHTVILLSSSTLHALGSNRKDQLNGLEALRDVECVGCTWNGTYALLRTGEVVATGSDTHSQLGRGLSGAGRQGTLAPVQFPFEPRPGHIVDMTCGSEHVLCVVERAEQDGESVREVWGWGWNEHGNLGIGGTEDVDVPVKIWPSTGNQAGEIVKIWAGCGTSWILVEQ